MESDAEGDPARSAGGPASAGPVAGMVRVATNWSHVRGVVLDVADVGDPSGYLSVSLQLAAVAPVPGQRNMLRAGPGEQLQVLMSKEAIDRLAVRPGVELDADVRRADQTRSFVHPERVHVEASGSGGEADSGGEAHSGGDADPAGAPEAEDGQPMPPRS